MVGMEIAAIPTVMAIVVRITVMAMVILPTATGILATEYRFGEIALPRLGFV